LIDLGTIAIYGESSVLEARNKIRSVAEAMSYPVVEATRLATATSEIARLCLQQFTDSIDPGEPRIVLHAEPFVNGATLVVDFVGSDALKRLDRVAGLFERVERALDRDGEYTIRAHASRLEDLKLDDRLVGRLQAIVEKKGREELLAEIRSKNWELQESLDNLRRTRSAKERMESELNIGAEIQMSMLPLEFPAFPERADFDVHAALYPAREVGGDFYDLFLIDDNHFCFCVGDVSGKGVPAALFMAVTKTLIKSRAANDLSPASILSHVNSELSHRNESCMFVTVFLGILDLRSGDVAYGNAGHNPPYLKRANGELERIDQRHGPVIGAADGLAYRQDHLVMDAGDLLFLYTDGVTEAMDVDETLYSEDRLRDLLAEKDLSSVERAVQVGVDDVWAFQGEAEQADDVTVLSVVYEGRTVAVEAQRLELRIVNRLEEIDRVNSEVSAFAERHGLETKTRRTLNLVFDELLNNAISYAYEDDEQHEIDLTVAMTESRLYATISDDGMPFNPFDNRTPDIELSVEERPIGGLGVHLVLNVMDHVTYERRGSRNVISMEKQLDLSEE
jgi:sigma-B regulation protein RsbU (phosphoserine phosphatase)